MDLITEILLNLLLEQNNFTLTINNHPFNRGGFLVDENPELGLYKN